MKKKDVRIKEILLYNLFFIIASIGFYFLIPIMLNYPPNSINNEFEISIDDGMTYDFQYFTIIAVAMFIFNIFFIRQIYKVLKYKEYINKNDSNSSKKLDDIKRACFSAPYKIYIVHATIPSIAIFVILCLTGADISLTWKIVVLIFIFTLVLGLLSYISSKQIFRDVLVELNNRQKYKGNFKINFKGKIFLLILPLILAAILFSAFVTNRSLSKERGDFLFENYYTQIITKDFDNIQNLEELVEKLSDIKKRSEKDSTFVISENDTLYMENENNQIDDFFRKYVFMEMSENRAYGYYTSPIQGTYVMCMLGDTQVAAGILYNIETENTTTLIIYTVLVLTFMCIFFLYYFSRDIGNQIVSVSDNIKKIANEETIDYDQKMAVVSNDEIGDLVISFNKILDLEKKHTSDMKRNQEILVEQERLSSLGQMIGGIAHNLKTPIMSISGASQAIKDLIKEYDMSISNTQVTAEDHHEIAKEMNDWNNKIKVYLEYMTEIIDAAKGQTVTMNSTEISKFTVGELVARVKILMKEQLIHRNCNLVVNMNISEDVSIIGEISALVQVLNNLVVNAIDAYNNKGGEIILSLSERNNKLYISVKDFAGGIPQHIQEKLFKQMITTKGKDGTGLGLYMCYSTIKGKFNGDMSFKTEAGKGTEFIIELDSKK